MIAMELCTTKQAADKLGVTSRTVLLWSKSGLIESWKTPGGHRRFSSKEVDELASSLVENKNILEFQTSLEKSLRILVIEDDAHILNLYNLNINSWGLPIHLFLSQDGYDGLYQAGYRRPELIILDLNLPKVDGLQIIATLIKNNHFSFDDLIIVTGMPKYKIHHDLSNIKDIRLLKKPIDFDLIREIAEAKLKSKDVLQE
jgi:excisionase family DNA binding protein